MLFVWKLKSKLPMTHTRRQEEKRVSIYVSNKDYEIQLLLSRCSDGKFFLQLSKEEEGYA